jgi:hypothetical protein
MCALQFAVEAVKSEGIGKADAEVSKKISELEKLTADYTGNNS